MLFFPVILNNNQITNDIFGGDMLAQLEGILAPQPGIETTSPLVEAQSPNHWTTREVPLNTFIESIICVKHSILSLPLNSVLILTNNITTLWLFFNYKWGDSKVPPLQFLEDRMS